ncbi:hypothetical protein DT594_08280 [Halopseudomonas laoshanensis]|uniref:Histidine kinase n=1 Tax=Halopseudomonas laoshanensis TaxID=2268758 RepID=A0A7V7GW60_9GAMM|nr:hypothetical protein [Halopseudomonas laoshanensis]KAA0694866.1 hypothetical protein DT594_08280 [Halopseudomonas laoshanensis]
MNPTPPPSENLFLRSYGAWRQHSVKLTGKLLMLSILPLALLVLWMGILAFGELKQSTARQADAIGEALASQIAAAIAEPLAAGDQLSLNIMLAQWQQNPLVAHTRVFTTENRMIAEAGDRVSATRMAPGQGQFNAAVRIQDTLAGQVQLSLASEPFMAPVNGVLRQLAWAALLLALGVGFIAWRMAGNMRRVLQQLGEWQADSPAPGQHRRDELGDLARQLGRRYEDPALQDVTAAESDGIEAGSSDADALSVPEPQLENPTPFVQTTASEPDLNLDTSESINPAEARLPEELGAHLLTPDPTDHSSPAVAEEEGQSDTDSKDEQGQDQLAATPTTATQKAVDAAHADAALTEEVALTPPAPLETTVLAIRLGNQEALRRLPRPRLMALLGRYREQLGRACELYNGHLQTLHDGTSLVVFNAGECRQDELTHALCCGELLRVLGHDLQVEIADTGITLHLHLALCHAPSLQDVPAEDLAHQPACQTLIEQVQYSRNLLLLDSSLATSDMLRQRAVVRRLASQPGIYCIERLQDPYQAMLEQQLNHFYQQRQS